MSSAAAAPALRAPQSGEPTTLHELYERARVDVASKDATAPLRWVFLHARIAGRLEVARGALKRIETRDWEVHSRALSFVDGSVMQDKYMAARPDADLKRAEGLVTELASMEQAARDVIELLKARR